MGQVIRHTRSPEIEKIKKRLQKVEKALNLKLIEEFTLTDLTQGTIDAYRTASGTLSTFQSYYQEASRLIDIAVARGTISPAYAEGIRRVLSKWYDYSDQWTQRVKEAAVADDRTKLLDTDREMKGELSTLSQKVQEIHAEIVGYKPVWNEIRDLFSVQSSNEEETAVFRNITHERLLHDFRKWLEKRNMDKKIFGNITHGLREAGIDIIAETSSEPRIKIGVQVKDNNDVKKEDFAKQVKTQITDSKKHDVKGLIIVFCGDLTDNSVREKVRGMTSELSQMKNYIKTVPPEKALTILREVG